MTRFYIVQVLIIGEHRSALFTPLLHGQATKDINPNWDEKPKTKKIKTNDGVICGTSKESYIEVTANSVDDVWNSAPPSVVHFSNLHELRNWSIRANNAKNPESGYGAFKTIDFIVLTQDEFVKQIAQNPAYNELIRNGGNPSDKLIEWKETIDAKNELTPIDVVTEETPEVGDVNTKMTKESILKVVKPYIKEVTEKRILDLRYWEIKSEDEQDRNALKQNRTRKSAFRFNIKGYRFGYCSDGYWAQSDKRFNSPTYYLKNKYVK